MNVIFPIISNQYVYIRVVGLFCNWALQIGIYYNYYNFRLIKMFTKIYITIPITAYLVLE